MEHSLLVRSRLKRELFHVEQNSSVETTGEYSGSGYRIQLNRIL